MDKFHERKMNDLYKSPNGKCLEKFEFVKKFKLVECRTVHQVKLFSALSKTVHCFLMKIVHYFLHKLFLVFCIKLFSVQHSLKNCSLSFLRKLFSVHCLKNCSLFSHKTLSEIMFSKFTRQI